MSESTCYTLPDGDCVGGPCMHNPDVKAEETPYGRALRATNPLGHVNLRALVEAYRELDEYEHLAALMRKREEPYITRWQLENDRPNTLPDYGEFLLWLLEALDVARDRRRRTQDWLERFQGAAADQAVQIMELRGELEQVKAQLKLSQRLNNRLPLCPDHRDKMPEDACLACGVEGIVTWVSVGWPAQKWVHNVSEIRSRLLRLLGREESDARPAA